MLVEELGSKFDTRNNDVQTAPEKIETEGKFIMVAAYQDLSESSIKLGNRRESIPQINVASEYVGKFGGRMNRAKVETCLSAVWKTMRRNGKAGSSRTRSASPISSRISSLSRSFV